MKKSELLERVRKVQRELNDILDAVLALPLETDETDHAGIPEKEDYEEWLTQKEVCQRLKISASTFYEAVRTGIFPKGLAITERNKRWRLSDILAHQNSNQNDTLKRRGRVSRVRNVREFMSA